VFGELSAPTVDASEILRLFLLGRAENTRKAYEGDLAAFATFAGASDAAAALARLLSLPKPVADAVAHEWRASLLSSFGSSAKRARRLTTLRSFVKTAERYGVVNWQLDVDIPTVQKYRDTAGPGLAALQRMAVAAEGLSGLSGLRARLVLELISAMGLRREEVANLRVGSYDAQSRKFTVEGKKKKIVVMSVPESTANAIEEWLRSSGKTDPSDFLVQRLDGEGGRVTGRTIYKIIARVAALVGVRTWPHGIRHTAITEVTRDDGLAAASKFARHTDVKTTMIYQDNLEDAAGKAAEKLSRKIHGK
jgi:integrase/recombinase XerC